MTQCDCSCVWQYKSPNMDTYSATCAFVLSWTGLRSFRGGEGRGGKGRGGGVTSGVPRCVCCILHKWKTLLGIGPIGIDDTLQCCLLVAIKTNFVCTMVTPVHLCTCPDGTHTHSE